jgi:PAS domain S-box-containing protein
MAAVLFVAAAMIAGTVVFSLASPEHGGIFRFIWVLPMLWAALRFGRAMTAITAVAISFMAFATLGRMDFTIDVLDRLSLQGSLISASLTGLAVAAMLSGQRRAIRDLEAALRALDASEQRYATLFAGSPLIQILVDPATWMLVEANPAAAAFYGWSQEELRTMRVTDIDTAPPSTPEEAVDTGLPDDGQVHAEHRLASGELRQVHIMTGQVRIGDRLLLHSVIRDVTAELAARTEIARLAAVVESSAESIVTTDLDGLVTGWNPAAEQLYGYRRGDVLGRQVDDVLGPVEMGVEELAGIVLDGRSVRFGQVIRRTAEGEAVPVDLTVSPIIDGDVVVGLSRISHDLRHVLEERERLARSQAMLADAAEIGGMGSWELDRAAGVATWSGELYRLAGVDPGTTVTATTLVELAHPEDRERLAAAIVDERPPAAPVPFRLVGHDGHERSMVATWRHVVGGTGSSGRDIGVVRDVTDERALEEQLRLAQRMESIGMLAGGVAHDFNNLLTAIGGFTDLARASIDEGISPEQDLLQVQAAVERARALTSQLLAFGRRAIIRPQPVDTAVAIGALVPLLRRLLGERVLIISELEADVVVAIDPGQLDQVLMNLAVNARDAMPDGGRLRIATGRTGAAGDDTWPAMAWIEVEDDGEGIAPHLLDQIFLPFFTTKGRGQGTGLGLSTVQGIVGQAGGRITVRSRIGEGTVVRIELPTTAAIPAVAAEGQPRERPTGTGFVLLVEDEDLVRRVGERVLLRAGFRVVTAANVPDALALAERERPDILVTDIVLPGVGDGIVLAETLRGRWPDLPVLIMTGYTERTPPDWAELLTKPYDVVDLVATVRRLLDGAARTPVA